MFESLPTQACVFPQDRFEFVGLIVILEGQVLQDGQADLIRLVGNHGRTSLITRLGVCTEDMVWSCKVSILTDEQ